MKVFLLGLRRSGTTIFFEAFRRDGRFTCYDEPLSPYLSHIPEPFEKRTWEEYYDLFSKNNDLFWRKFSSVSWDEELDESLSERQVEWIRFLLAGNGSVMIEETHLHFKIRSLYERFPDAYVIHLHRRASAFTSSHLLPSRSGSKFRNLLLARLRSFIRRRRFWTTNTGFDAWRVETIIGGRSDQRFGCVLGKYGFDSEAVFSQSGVGRLLAYWLLHYKVIESDGKQLFAGRFLSVRFEEFCEDPNAVMSRIYNSLKLSFPNEPLPVIRKAALGHEPTNARWQDAAKAVGFSEREIRDLL